MSCLMRQVGGDFMEQLAGKAVTEGETALPARVEIMTYCIVVVFVGENVIDHALRSTCGSNAL